MGREHDRRAWRLWWTLICIAGCGWTPSGDRTASQKSQQTLVSETSYVEVNGARLHYQRMTPAEPSTKAPLVLVHGLTLDMSVWDPLFEALAEHFVTYRFDMRGHGLSSAVTGPVALHEDLLGFMDTLGIAKAQLVGFSLGGNVVTELAAAHPERVETLVLIDSGINGFPYPTPNLLQRLPTYLAVYAREGRTAALEAWLKDPVFGASSQNDVVRAALERMVLSCPCSLFFEPQLLVRPDTYNRLSSITAPTLVLIGTRETEDLQAASRALQRRIVHARYRAVAGAGHMVPLEQPRAVLEAIMQLSQDGLILQ